MFKDRASLELHVRSFYHDTVQTERNKGFFVGTRLEFTPIFLAFIEVTQVSVKGISDDGTQNFLGWTGDETCHFVHNILADIQPEYIQYPKKKYDYFQREAHKKFLKETAIMHFEAQLKFFHEAAIKNRINIEDSNLLTLINESSESIKAVYRYTPLRLKLKWSNNDMIRFVDKITDKFIRKNLK